MSTSKAGDCFTIPESVPVEDLSIRHLLSSRIPMKRKLSSASTRTSSSDGSTDLQLDSEIPSAVLDHVPILASGYCHSFWRNTLYWTLCLLSAGTLCLLSSWFQVLSTKLRRKSSPIDKCDSIVLKTMNGKSTLVAPIARRVRLVDLRLSLCQVSKHDIDRCVEEITSNEMIDVIVFEFRCQRFILDPWNIRFVNIELSIENLTFSKIWEIHGNGIEDPTAISSRRDVFGTCEVYIPLKSSLELIVSECLHPFYVFQVCSLTLWFVDNYYYYASAVLILSCISLFVSIRETIRNNRNLHEMARFSLPIRVVRRPNKKCIFPRLTELSFAQVTEHLQQINSTELVPGDIFVLERGMKLPCDGILLVGNALVDESMMTGEAKPIYKTSIPALNIIEEKSSKSNTFSFKKHYKHVLYGGSEIRDASHLSGHALCLVAKTGFTTEQGRMMRSLVHPVGSIRMNFETETWKFVGLLACMSCFTFGLTLYQGIANGLHPLTVFARSIDTVTIAVPPALPIIISVGIICAQDALKKQSKTRCLMPSRINVAGRANVMVFDKTGTLTEDDEDLLAVVPSSIFSENDVHTAPSDITSPSLLSRFPKGLPSTVSQVIHCSSEPLHLSTPVTSPDALSQSLVAGLATCHSLSFVEDELIGDPLEYQMFNFTGWKLRPPRRKDLSDSEELNANFCEEEVNTEVPMDLDMYISVSPTDEDIHDDDLTEDQNNNLSPRNNSPLRLPSSSFCSYAILRVFEFDSHLQRMSVIVQNRDTGQIKVFCKGSPERVLHICDRNSVPLNSDDILSGHTERGLRVLAIAEKNLTLDTAPCPLMLQHLKREDLEKNMTFMGFLLFTNLLRPDTASAIEKLQASGCCIYMATGDGPVTGAAVGFQAGILPKGIKYLIQGIMIKGQLRWRIKGFPTACVEIDDQSLVDVTACNVENAKESQSLLELVQGKCLSNVGLAITGEAFRYVVAVTTSESSSPCPVLLDQFEVDAFSTIKKPRFASCLPHKVETATQEGIRKWDNQPHLMGSLEFILKFFQIFSRMSPDDKALLIEQLQNLPHQPIVGMCGDGANDCAALKAADVGVSLSSKEASVAAPFNCSYNKSIHVVLDVLKEGRGALANSIQNFQFVALYALIQLCTVTILSHFGYRLADSQFLYMDLAVVLPLTYFMSWSKSSTVLTRSLPPQSLLAWSIVVSLIGQVLIQVIFQGTVLFFLLPYARPFEDDHEKIKGDYKEENVHSFGYENTVAFMISNLQTVLIALILALGARPHKNVKRNVSFLVVASLYTIIGFALVLNEAPYTTWLRTMLGLTSLPLAFRTILLVAISLNILLSVILEEGLVRKVLRRLEAWKDKQMLNRESLRDVGVDEMVLESTRDVQLTFTATNRETLTCE